MRPSASHQDDDHNNQCDCHHEDGHGSSTIVQPAVGRTPTRVFLRVFDVVGAGHEGIVYQRSSSRKLDDPSLDLAFLILPPGEPELAGVGWSWLACVVPPYSPYPWTLNPYPD